MDDDSRRAATPGPLSSLRTSLILAAIALAWYAAMIVNHLPS